MHYPTILERDPQEQLHEGLSDYIVYTARNLVPVNFPDGKVHVDFDERVTDSRSGVTGVAKGTLWRGQDGIGTILEMGRYLDVSRDVDGPWDSYMLSTTRERRGDLDVHKLTLAKAHQHLHRLGGCVIQTSIMTYPEKSLVNWRDHYGKDQEVSPPDLIIRHALHQPTPAFYPPRNPFGIHAEGLQSGGGGRLDPQESLTAYYYLQGEAFVLREANLMGTTKNRWYHNAPHVGLELSRANGPRGEDKVFKTDERLELVDGKIMYHPSPTWQRVGPLLRVPNTVLLEPNAFIETTNELFNPELKPLSPEEYEALFKQE